MKVLNWSLAICGVLGLSVMGCKRGSNDTPPAAFPGGAGVQGGASYGAYAGGPAGNAPAGTPSGNPYAAQPGASTAPAMTAAPTGYGPPPGAPVTPGMGAPSAPAPGPVAMARPCDPTETLTLNTAIETRAKTEARGMTAAGGLVCSYLPQGESSASAGVILEPGKCYTALAQGLGITELDVQLVVDPAGAGAMGPLLAGMAGTALASDASSGPAATLGAGKDCFSPTFGPFPVPAKVVVRSRGGSGPAFAQLYVKKK